MNVRMNEYQAPEPPHLSPRRTTKLRLHGLLPSPNHPSPLNHSSPLNPAQPTDNQKLTPLNTKYEVFYSNFAFN
ncbi:MAG: hypothetical protein ACI8P3_003355 [Saprospiraceae bacterium]|jgi:hypothetical protein